MAKKNQTVEETVDSAIHHGEAAADNGNDSEGKRSRRRVADSSESKGDKFTRLLVQRLPRLVKACKAISNLFGSMSYEWTDEQRDIALSLIVPAVNGMMDVIQGRTKQSDKLAEVLSALVAAKK